MRLPNADGRFDNLTPAQMMDALGLDVPEGFSVGGGPDQSTLDVDMQQIAMSAEMIEKLLGAAFQTLHGMGLNFPDTLNAMGAGFGGFLGIIMRCHKESYPDPVKGEEGITDKDREEMIAGVCDCAKLNGMAQYRQHELMK